MSTYTPEQVERIARLHGSIAKLACPMAVVDFLGRVDGAGWIDADSSLDRRFGTRDMRHVAIYKLEVVLTNVAAAELQEA